jgi:hypothetical protein
MEQRRSFADDLFRDRDHVLVVALARKRRKGWWARPRDGRDMDAGLNEPDQATPSESATVHGRTDVSVRTLYGLVALAVLMSVGHHVDHVIRGNNVG